MSPPVPNKKEVADALLQASFSIFVHLDPRAEHVVVPRQFQTKAHLVLEVGLNMPVPIPDLTVDDEGISCTLSFSHRPFWCRLPWQSIFMMVTENKQGMIWPEDAPPEVRVPAASALGPPPKAAPVRTRPVLAVAKDPAEEDAEPPVAEPDDDSGDAPPRAAATNGDEPPPKKRELPPYLKVIK